jgi:hypothetical protein
MNPNRVLLMQLSERTSAKGNTYLSGWLAAAAALLAGLWCQRSATFAGELEDRDEAKARTDVPGD